MITIPGYQFLTPIYESANSLVYRGIRESGNQPVILKVLKEDYPTPSELTRYKQEYEITRNLNIDGVVKAYGLEPIERTLAIILEDFGATSLNLLKKTGGGRWSHLDCARRSPSVAERSRGEAGGSFGIYPIFSLPEFLQLAIKIAEILAAIHTANVIHKDINPSNIVLNPVTGQLKIIDFGISTLITRSNPTLKNPNVLEGTLAYISPEQTGRMNRSLDYRTDFYSLGVTFYELLTGKLPFETNDALELVHCHIAQRPISPHQLVEAEDVTSIPKAISDIVMKLMEKTAEERYQSAWGLKADLEECLYQLQTTGNIEPFPLGSTDISDKFQIPQKLYGREAEVKTLLAAFERVAGGKGEENLQLSVPKSQIEMMLVRGYSGVGKSALVQEIYKPLTEKRGYFLTGKFDQFKRNIPYSAIVSAFGGLVQQLLTETEAQLEQWREKLRCALGSNAQLIIDVIPEVELIVGKQPPIPELGAAESQNRFHLVFQNFIRTFCLKEHPLVIFLDDLQWADSASLKLIELMMTDAETQYLFLIGAYRDNEVSSTHPLMMTLDRLLNFKVTVNFITLAPLQGESINQLIAATLHADMASVSHLAELVVRKTEGNPFFVNQFLRTLHTDNLLTFNFEFNAWQWNLAQIQAMNITDNVVELMIHQLKKLPESTQYILRLAACVGAEFDLKTVSIICKKSPNEVFSSLVMAVQPGLILSISELDENLLVQNYKFLHDRVQQAAYALIDDEQKPIIHLEIGRLLLQNISFDVLSNEVFEIVDHLNLGVELVTHQQEQNEIAKLNLIAGKKAKAATAYSAAVEYLNIGLKLLSADSWQSEYDLTLALYEEAAEATYLNGDFITMEQLALVVLNNAKTVLHKVKVYDVKIQASVSQSNLKEAVKIGLQVLNLLGVILPEEPSQLDVKKGLEETASLLAEQEIEGLIDLPKMSEPEKLAAMLVLSSIASASFITTPNLFLLIALSKINLSIKYGNTELSAFAYSQYTVVLCGILQDIESAYKFGKLSLSLGERLNAQKVKAKIGLGFGAHTMHWKEHFKETISVLIEGYQSGVEIGDFEYAGYCACYVCEHLYFIGQELTQLEQQIASYSKAIARIKQEASFNWTAIFQQAVLNLLGKAENPIRLFGDAYNEEQNLSFAIKTNNRIELLFFYLNKLILCYLFGDTQQAVQNAVLAKPYLEGLATMLVNGLLHFYDSLAHLSAFFEASDSEKETWLNWVNANQEKMQKWAYHAPMNYLHKFYLVEAEKARVLGKFFEAEEFYEQAIQGARENEYIQEEALAYELAAKFYLARGRLKFAQTYMQEAHYTYIRWGAIAKVKNLEQCYPQFFTKTALSQGIKPYTSNAIFITDSKTSNELDLSSVLKASQILSGEIVLTTLLEKMMKIVLENAGAQKGYLILKSQLEPENQNGQWVIEASGTVDNNEFKILPSIPIETVGGSSDSPILCDAIANYVIRTQERVVLNDAYGEGTFTRTPYIVKQQPKSILCTPLLNQGKLVGILYLENNLTTGAFTPDRLEVLELLSSQAAISIENAKLYTEVRESERRLAQFLEAIPIGIGVLDAQGRPYYANRTAVELLGKEVEPSATAEQLGEVYQVYVAGTSQKYPSEQLPIVRALRGEQAIADDIEIHQGDRIIPVEGRGTPVFDEKGNVAYAITTIQDITERKQAQQILTNYNRTLEKQVAERTAALQESEASLKAAQRVAHVGSWEFDVITQKITWSEEQFRIFGLDSTQSEPTYEQHIQQIHPDDRASVQESYAQTIKTGRSEELDFRIIRPNGEVRYVSRRCEAVVNEQGQIIKFFGTILDITERKLAELELQEQKDLRETIYNESADALFLVDPETLLISDCNHRAVELFEANSKAELLGIQGQRLQVRSFSLEELSEITAQIQQKGFWSQEIEYVTRKGNLFWGNLAAKRVAIANQPFDLVRITDITERKYIEEALRQSEARFQKIAAASPAQIYILAYYPDTGEMQYEYISSGVREIQELEPEKVSTDALLTYNQVHPDDRALYNQITTQSLRTLEPFAHEWRIITPSGKMKWVRANSRPERRQNGEIAWYGVLLDITDLKQAEVALRESEERFRHAFHDAPIGMALLGLDNRWLQINPVLGEMLAYSESKLLTLSASQLVHPEDVNQFHHCIEQVFTNENRNAQIELRYLCNGGRIAWGLTSLSLVRDFHNQPLYYVVQIQDITEQHAIEQLKNEFVSIVSHELRTPLTAIRGFLGLLNTGIYDNKPEKAKRMLQQALTNSDRLVRLVNDILDLERLSSGRVQLVREICNAEDLMQRAVEGVQSIALGAAITLSMTPTTACVWASSDLIIQTLTNLLSNAIKFSPPHSVITLSAKLQSDSVLFQVKDQGRGIPADKLETIFERFQQVDISDARAKGGTGLGLAICRRIIQQHDGSIWAESRLGEGSTFYFSLPISPGES
ncbi:PAS domain S-box protein [Nostoc sp. UHCC 0302]|uniref:PAS domain S-box protein n=1 Tax=Nostoc sp. UHCC 0302 TaxID=3134896 RepID=UPI00311CBF33